MQEIKLGKYIHSKSKKMYEVIGIGRHSETLEEFVVYKALYNSSEYGNESIWLRPIEMFKEKVEVNGEIVLRFKFIG